MTIKYYNIKKHLIAFITLIIVSFTACSNQNVSETNIERNNNIENAKLNHNVTLLVTSDIHGSVDEKHQAIGNAMSEVIGKTDYNLYINDPVAKKDDGSPVRIIRNVETNLGDLVADAYKIRTGADCAYTNGGGTRVDVNAGDITLKDIKSVQPFGNIVCLLEVTGQ